MTMSKRVLGVTLWTWWMLVLCTAVSSAGTWLAVDHANANQRRSQERSNQQFRKAQILANHKFQQAIRIANSQASYSINKSVCGFRSLIGPTLSDKRIPPARRSQLEAFLATQVTVPAGFDCKTLPKNPPKAKP